MTDFQIATVGDNCIDRLAAPLAVSLIGGNALNVAVQLSALCHRVAYFGAIGNDPEGDRTLATLKEMDVETAHTRVVEGITAYTEISVDEAGNRRMDYEEFGVCRGYFPDHREIDRLLRMRHVHLGWIDDGGRLRRLLTEAGVSVSQDVSVNADPENLQVEGLAFAFASAGASLDEAVAVADHLLARGARTAIVTRAEYGSIAKNASEYAETGIEPVSVVDTTGAGDSFIAGFLSGCLCAENLFDCIVKGRKVAAVTCTHLGGFPQPAVPL